MVREKLEKFTDRIIADVNAAMSCLSLYIGHRLPQSMVFPDSAAIGTVMNPSRLRKLAAETGFSKFEVLPVENEFWRFYQLKQ